MFDAQLKVLLRSLLKVHGFELCEMAWESTSGHKAHTITR